MVESPKKTRIQELNWDCKKRKQRSVTNSQSKEIFGEFHVSILVKMLIIVFNTNTTNIAILKLDDLQFSCKINC